MTAEKRSLPSAKADLHVHSRYSERRSEWALQKLSPTNCFTDPLVVYQQARQRGMDFVTITDHNRIDGSLMLAELHPERCFTGVESTAMFPEDGCKVNLLIYGLSGRDFLEVQRLRRDIYQLRGFLRERGLPHSVAHAIYSINGRLTLETLEKLILLFDVFEGINGGRGWINNSTWMRALRGLSPEQIETLRCKHHIEPFSETPWIKRFTGGSDDHAGVFVGSTWTAAHGDAVHGFLDSVRHGPTSPGGRSMDYRSLAFTTFKIAYEQSCSRPSGGLSNFLTRQLTTVFFKSTSLSLLDKLKWKTLRTGGRLRNDRAAKVFIELAERCMEADGGGVETRLDYAYEKITEIWDTFTDDLFDSAEKAARDGKIVPLVQSAMGAVPIILLALPFLTSLKYLYRERELMRGVVEAHASAGNGSGNGSGNGGGNGKRSQTGNDNGAGEGAGKRILWFTDTLNDVNGPSVTLKKIGWLSHEKGRDIKIVTSMPPDEIPPDLPPNLVNLPYVRTFTLPFYGVYLLTVPSALKSLEMLAAYEPDEVYISTPGPVGLVGLLFGKLVKARCIGIYHTDYLLQAADIVEDDSILNTLEDFTRSVYSAMDEIAVPTQEYISILANRGYDATKMRLFQRGIDSVHFRPRPDGREFLRERFGIPSGINLLYIGRISKDKRLDFLLEVFRRLRKRHDDVNLVLTGAGPYLEGLKQQAADLPAVHFTGRQELEVLPRIYSGCDLFVFPSTCDTFGMAVLEAQSCGLPAFVSDVGGPKEIVVDNETGWVLPANNPDAWTRGIGSMIGVMREKPDVYHRFRERARLHVTKRQDWDQVLQAYVEGIPLWPSSDRHGRPPRFEGVPA